MSHKIRTLIVDDEPLALDYLDGLLKSDPGVTVVGRCKNGREALAMLRESPVDLVFMDVQMPVMSGLEVIAEIQAEAMPMVVFATAYDQFACPAFELNAVDYLLKPIDPQRLTLTLERCRDRYMSRLLMSEKSSVVGALNQLRNGNGGLDGPAELYNQAKLPIKDGGQTYLVALVDIDWIDAAGDYMCVHANGKTHILRSTMKELELRLTDQFVRIHRSTIVNLAKILSVESLPKSESALHLEGGARLKVSRKYRDAIKSFIESH